MALTTKILGTEPVGGRMKKLATVTFDNSYTTGGKALLPADFGMKTIAAVMATSQDGFLFSYDYTNQKLKAYAGAAEVTNATNLATLVVRVIVYGL